VQISQVRHLLSEFPALGERKHIMSMKLYVGNLSFNTSNQDLSDLFSQAGTVESANVIEDRETGRSRGFGFVEMSSKAEGQAAIEQLNGKEIDGRELKVNEAKAREERGGGGRGGYGGGGGRGGNRGGGGGYGGGGYGGGRW
jgi:RNA recognition motif-containing protein